MSSEVNSSPLHSHCQAFSLENNGTHPAEGELLELELYKRQRHQNLTQQLQQQVQLSKLINQISNEIRSTLDLEEILNSACRLLGQALKCSRASILVVEPNEEDSLTTMGEYNQGDYPSQLGSKVPFRDNPHLQALIAQPRALAVTRFLEFPGLTEQIREVAQGLQIRSMMALATRYQGKVNGIIGLHQCDREREWTPWEMELLEGVGSQLAIAINQAWLYSETRRQVEQESLLRLVTNQIRSTLDLQTILQTVVREVRHLLDTDRVVIYQFLDANWQGEVVVEEVISPWISALGQLSQDNCFSAKYAQQYQGGRVRAIHNIFQAGLDPCHVRFLERLQVKANLIVPIVIRSKLWGLLIAQECGAPRVWQAWETELLQKLADQVAIAIQQAQLYTQVQTAAAQSQAQAETLKATLEELQTTQMQLLQSEKLSSLGQMVAGVAHEINNAITFIHANLPYAQRYTTALNQAIALYEDCCPNPPEAIAELIAEQELGYVREDFPKLISSMEEGTKRIREIVLTLRNFSRLDEAERKSVDLHEGIESTLLILQHRVKTGVKIDKLYGELPSVECHAGQINQVFLNLLANALDAAGEKANITIQTWHEGDRVVVSIRDDGPGIPLELQERIFDPFFTTKEVGKGTGLGLSICYQIVVKGHKGRLQCCSQPGAGAEFRIVLPVSACQPTATD
ncbi:GAF domain-containing protein [Trichocoleus desertorum AS-A10]|uniref:GAF domain-containing sensor histidine kinase n=1 Tax=Trichocoleus desertorum TaxID=1481672 RepID=UPI003297A1E9